MSSPSALSEIVDCVRLIEMYASACECTKRRCNKIEVELKEASTWSAKEGLSFQLRVKTNKKDENIEGIQWLEKGIKSANDALWYRFPVAKDEKEDQVMPAKREAPVDKPAPKSVLLPASQRHLLLKDA
ncbi:hypothetical protein TrVGV298_009572 [Trichoderma virens]|nr:hypothetical protein TrVGV298_009572 [Trichoderma virens]